MLFADKGQSEAAFALAKFSLDGVASPLIIYELPLLLGHQIWITFGLTKTRTTQPDLLMCTEHKIPNEQSGANSEPGNVLEPAEQSGIALEHPTDRVDRGELVEAVHIVAQSLRSTGLVAVLQERVNYIYYGKMGIGLIWL